MSFLSENNLNSITLSISQSLILASLVLLGVLAPMSYAEEVAPKATVTYYTKYVETSGVKRYGNPVAVTPRYKGPGTIYQG